MKANGNPMLRRDRFKLGGTTLSFVNYVDEFPYFRDEVLPRLKAQGLRSCAFPVAA